MQPYFNLDHHKKGFASKLSPPGVCQGLGRCSSRERREWGEEVIYFKKEIKSLMME